MQKLSRYRKKVSRLSTFLISEGHIIVTFKKQNEYEDSLKAYRDVKNSIDTALEKGREEGKNWKAIQIAKKMLDAGMDIETVMQITDLSKSEIEKLK